MTIKKKLKEVYLIDKNDDDLNNGRKWSKDDGLNNGNDLKETGEDICDEFLLVIIKSKWLEVDIKKFQLIEDHEWKTFEKKKWFHWQLKRQK